MNYQWQVNTMVGDERDLEDEVQSGKSHRRETRRRSKHRSKLRRGCWGLGRWCTKCCERQEDSDGDSIKSDASFFKRRRRKKRKRTRDRERLEVDAEDEGESSEELASSEADQVSEEDVPRAERKKSRRKRRKLRRSSEDSLFKASEEAEDRKREEDLELLEPTAPDAPHHHLHKYHNNDHHSKSEERPRHLETGQELDYHSPKAEKARKHHGARRKLDFEKSCCYLCARTTLAMAAAGTSKSHRFSQVSAHDFPTRSAKKETCDKSCNPILKVRTVQSWVKVRTCDKSTHFPEPRKEKGKHKSKYKKFGIFPRVKLTKCPATRSVGCETETCARQDDRKKRIPKHERCCGERKPRTF